MEPSLSVLHGAQAPRAARVHPSIQQLRTRTAVRSLRRHFVVAMVVAATRDLDVVVDLTRDSRHGMGSLGEKATCEVDDG